MTRGDLRVWPLRLMQLIQLDVNQVSPEVMWTALLAPRPLFPLKTKASRKREPKCPSFHSHPKITHSGLKIQPNWI